MKILFCCSEAYPLAKTGGLGDVGGALPRALLKQGVQVKLVLPGYSVALANAKPNGLKLLNELEILGETVRIWQSRLAGSRVTVWFIDHKTFSSREGGLYGDELGVDWHDNAWRFYVYCKVAELIACNEAGLDWKADVVHCHDWQTGLIPALLNEREHRPKTVFTIHNLAYRGLFDQATFHALQLPTHWWHHESVEFWGEFSYLKAGLVYSDRVTTVSPSYAQEIQTPDFGCGLEGVLEQRKRHLTGIVNGIDDKVWNPGTDTHLSCHYNRRSLSKKQLNKTALQKELGLATTPDTLLLGFIGRLVEQKGLAILIPALEQFLAQTDAQFVALGSGQQEYETALLELAAKFPQQVKIYIGYDEGVSHRIEAGVDVFLMPSLFEPCGLNQMYSQRYGTLPLCHYVGGLRDTVVNLSDSQLEGYTQGSLGVDNIDETGFLFCDATATSLLATLNKAYICYQNTPLWTKMQKNGMAQDFSWGVSSQRYVDLYESLLKENDSQIRVAG
ncbi:glycogen synthase GlgA [Gilvimarinus sp. SDUM040013]|uniref:Glycogen synthase n=1 Tax=Gilvimarinus gilvus TaxID=3058038 RepID=A0ABU4RYI6_9GAMM|nr:glycogen synthase GlgA [Gilvimarinus sp. SDUM040013]MDO3385594.1 glycogen synthase GlgA [Gilvimarinus sp. SDUM040013]MDX6849928.1 glycogen synthase GlgA [Gilvimarinus sp. SDUM040013]